MRFAPKAFAVLHGHFYQPPRENPWTEEIELQPSAAPYHDWNERIDSECYRSNAFARISDGRGRILDIVNNYRYLSFNFGPTLLSWIQAKDPDTYRRILEADRDSLARLGHGNALAQAYNHMILPLATEAEKRTQIRWGIDDFRHRFGRAPEGLWLPETAADIPTLSALERAGIKFTILSPYQAERVRPLGSGQPWKDVGDGSVDPSRAYRCWLDPERKRSIVLFFYDGPVSHSISFQGVLQDASRFAERLSQAWAPARRHAQLIHVANDGETYGHHFRFGDMSLAYVLTRRLEQDGFAVTNYATYLAAHPPEMEVEIKSGPDGLGTAWSCAHGTLRWREDCGCQTGAQAGWNQKWRRPLRQALDWLRDRTDSVMNEFGPRLFKDPWAASDAFVQVLLRRTRTAVDRFLAREGRGLVFDADRSRALRLMEMRRNALLMYTSCGWFFADLSGIETLQCLQFAARAMELAETFPGVRLEADFLDLLDKARSNLPEWGSGKRVWNRAVRPARMDAERIAAHFGVTDLVRKCPEREELFRASIVRRHRVQHAAAIPSPQHQVARVVLNRIQVDLETTRDRARLLTACLRLGPRKVVCAVCPDEFTDEAFAQVEKKLREALHSHDGTELGEKRLRRLLAMCVGKRTFRLEDLLPDHRLHILEWLAHDVVTQLGEAYLELYAENIGEIESFRKAGMPPPREFTIAAEYALSFRLEELLREHRIVADRTLPDGRVPPLGAARALVDEVGRLGVVPTAPAVAQKLGTLLLASIDFLGQTWDPRVGAELSAFLEALRQWQVPVDLRRAQDRFARVILRERGRVEAGATRVFASRARVRKSIDGLAEAIGFAPEAVAKAFGEE